MPPSIKRSNHSNPPTTSTFSNSHPDQPVLLSANSASLTNDDELYIYALSYYIVTFLSSKLHCLTLPTSYFNNASIVYPTIFWSDAPSSLFCRDILPNMSYLCTTTGYQNTFASLPVSHWISRLKAISSPQSTHTYTTNLMNNNSCSPNPIFPFNDNHATRNFHSNPFDSIPPTSLQFSPSWYYSPSIPVPIPHHVVELLKTHLTLSQPQQLATLSALHSQRTLFPTLNISHHGVSETESDNQTIGPQNHIKAENRTLDNPSEPILHDHISTITDLSADSPRKNQRQTRMRSAGSQPGSLKTLPKPTSVHIDDSIHVSESTQHSTNSHSTSQNKLISTSSPINSSRTRKDSPRYTPKSQNAHQQRASTKCTPNHNASMPIIELSVDPPRSHLNTSPHTTHTQVPAHSSTIHDPSHLPATSPPPPPRPPETPVSFPSVQISTTITQPHHLNVDKAYHQSYQNLFATFTSSSLAPYSAYTFPDPPQPHKTVKARKTTSRSKSSSSTTTTTNLATFAAPLSSTRQSTIRAHAQSQIVTPGAQSSTLSQNSLFSPFSPHSSQIHTISNLPPHISPSLDLCNAMYNLPLQSINQINQNPSWALPPFVQGFYRTDITASEEALVLQHFLHEHAPAGNYNTPEAYFGHETWNLPLNTLPQPHHHNSNNNNHHDAITTKNNNANTRGVRQTDTTHLKGPKTHSNQSHKLSVLPTSSTSTTPTSSQSSTPPDSPSGPLHPISNPTPTSIPPPPPIALTTPHSSIYTSNPQPSPSQPPFFQTTGHLDTIDQHITQTDLKLKLSPIHTPVTLHSFSFSTPIDRFLAIIGTVISHQLASIYNIDRTMAKTTQTVNQNNSNNIIHPGALSPNLLTKSTDYHHRPLQTLPNNAIVTYSASNSITRRLTLSLTNIIQLFHIVLTTQTHPLHRYVVVVVGIHQQHSQSTPTQHQIQHSTVPTTPTPQITTTFHPSTFPPLYHTPITPRIPINRILSKFSPNPIHQNKNLSPSHQHHQSTLPITAINFTTLQRLLKTSPDSYSLFFHLYHLHQIAAMQRNVAAQISNPSESARSRPSPTTTRYCSSINPTHTPPITTPNQQQTHRLDRKIPPAQTFTTPPTAHSIFSPIPTLQPQFHRYLPVPLQQKYIYPGYIPTYCPLFDTFSFQTPDDYAEAFNVVLKYESNDALTRLKYRTCVLEMATTATTDLGDYDSSPAQPTLIQKMCNINQVNRHKDHGHSSFFPSNKDRNDSASPNDKRAVDRHVDMNDSSTPAGQELAKSDTSTTDCRHRNLDKCAVADGDNTPTHRDAVIMNDVDDPNNAGIRRIKVEDGDFQISINTSRLSDKDRPIYDLRMHQLHQLSAFRAASIKSDKMTFPSLLVIENNFRETYHRCAHTPLSFTHNIASVEKFQLGKAVSLKERFFDIGSPKDYPQQPQMNLSPQLELEYESKLIEKWTQRGKLDDSLFPAEEQDTYSAHLVHSKHSKHSKSKHRTGGGVGAGNQSSLLSPTHPNNTPLSTSVRRKSPRHPSSSFISQLNTSQLTQFTKTSQNHPSNPTSLLAQQPVDFPQTQTGPTQKEYSASNQTAKPRGPLPPFSAGNSSVSNDPLPQTTSLPLPPPPPTPAFLSQYGSQYNQTQSHHTENPQNRHNADTDNTQPQHHMNSQSQRSISLTNTPRLPQTNANSTPHFLPHSHLLTTSRSTQRPSVFSARNPTATPRTQRPQESQQLQQQNHPLNAITAIPQLNRSFASPAINTAARAINSQPITTTAFRTTPTFPQRAQIAANHPNTTTAISFEAYQLQPASAVSTPSNSSSLEQPSKGYHERMNERVVQLLSLRHQLDQMHPLNTIDLARYDDILVANAPPLGTFHQRSHECNFPQHLTEPITGSSHCIHSLTAHKSPYLHTSVRDTHNANQDTQKSAVKYSSKSKKNKEITPSPHPHFSQPQSHFPPSYSQFAPLSKSNPVLNSVQFFPFTFPIAHIKSVTITPTPNILSILQPFLSKFKKLANQHLNTATQSNDNLTALKDQVSKVVTVMDLFFHHRFQSINYSSYNAQLQSHPFYQFEKNIYECMGEMILYASHSDFNLPPYMKLYALFSQISDFSAFLKAHLPSSVGKLIDSNRKLKNMSGFASFTDLSIFAMPPSSTSPHLQLPSNSSPPQLNIHLLTKAVYNFITNPTSTQIKQEFSQLQYYFDLLSHAQHEYVQFADTDTNRLETRSLANLARLHAFETFPAEGFDSEIDVISSDLHYDRHQSTMSDYGDVGNSHVPTNKRVANANPTTHEMSDSNVDDIFEYVESSILGTQPTQSTFSQGSPNKTNNRTDLEAVSVDLNPFCDENEMAIVTDLIFGEDYGFDSTVMTYHEDFYASAYDNFDDFFHDTFGLINEPPSDFNHSARHSLDLVLTEQDPSAIPNRINTDLFEKNIHNTSHTMSLAPWKSDQLDPYQSFLSDIYDVAFENESVITFHTQDSSTSTPTISASPLNSATAADNSPRDRNHAIISLKNCDSSTDRNNTDTTPPKPNTRTPNDPLRPITSPNTSNPNITPTSSKLTGSIADHTALRLQFIHELLRASNSTPTTHNRHQFTHNTTCSTLSPALFIATMSWLDDVFSPDHIAPSTLPPGLTSPFETTFYLSRLKNPNLNPLRYNIMPYPHQSSILSTQFAPIPLDTALGYHMYSTGAHGEAANLDNLFGSTARRKYLASVLVDPAVKVDYDMCDDIQPQFQSTSASEDLDADGQADMVMDRGDENGDGNDNSDFHKGMQFEGKLNSGDQGSNGLEDVRYPRPRGSLMSDHSG